MKILRWQQSYWKVRMIDGLKCVRSAACNGSREQAAGEDL